MGHGGLGSVNQGRVPTGAKDIERFQVLARIGSGATSHVYAVLDLNLERQIAVKVLRTPKPGEALDVAPFIDEARINADLRHPNVVPVHDLDVTANGELFFAMNHIEGQTLGDILSRCTLQDRGPRLGSFNAIVSIFLGIGHAVAFAHHKRIVHQDLKPDNILIGNFGEVLVLDWGSAVRISPGNSCTNRLYGTPLYMSPEQARSSHVDALSDIYCLGATLFHVLTLRLPTWSENVEEFWRRKRLGIIDPLTGDERSKVPPALLGIALKAMAPEASDRYPSMEALIEDLESYQAGLAVSAHRDSIGEFLTRIHRKYWRMLWLSGTACAVILLLVLALYGERLKEMAAWGSPALSEDFADERWHERWLVVDDYFRPNAAVQIRDGWLRTTGVQGTYVFNRTRISGPMAIEFDGRMSSTSPPGDLSIVWSRDDPDGQRKIGVPDGTQHLLIMMQTGAEDNTYAAIVHLPGGFHATTSPFRLTPDTVYHMRMEIDDGHLSIVVDGRLICEFTDTFPIQSGFVGLYGYYPGKEFSRVRIFSKGVPEKIGVLTIGDSYFLDGLYDRARDAFRKVSQSHAGRPIAQEALYKLGVAQLKLGDAAAAAQSWSGISDAHWSGLAQAQLLEQRAPFLDAERISQEFSRLYKADSGVQKRLRTMWSGLVSEAVGRHAFAQLRAYLGIQRGLFPAERECFRYAAEALNELEDFEQTLTRFRDVPKAREEALAALERWEEVVHDPDSYKQAVARAYLQTGQFDELEQRFPEVAWGADYANLYRGQVGELDRASSARGLGKGLFAQVLDGEFPSILANGEMSVEGRVLALTCLDRSQEAISILPRPQDPTVLLPAYLMRGEAERALRELPLKVGGRQWARYCLALDYRIAANRSGEQQMLAQIDGDRQVPGVEHSFFPRFLLRPFFGMLNGDAQAMSRAAATMKSHRFLSVQRVWYMGRLLGGELSDAEFLAQPCRVSAPALLLLGKGFQAEGRNDRVGALTAWRTFMSLPVQQRLIDFMVRDALVERFVLWRIAQLEYALRGGN
ncbi:MAG: protein kinase [Planctomycetes bacterium]|nr:protein kinase [Planctomycetota bacterium]